MAPGSEHLILVSNTVSNKRDLGSLEKWCVQGWGRKYTRSVWSVLPCQKVRKCSKKTDPNSQWGKCVKGTLGPAELRAKSGRV